MQKTVHIFTDYHLPVTYFEFCKLQHPQNCQGITIVTILQQLGFNQKNIY